MKLQKSLKRSKQMAYRSKFMINRTTSYKSVGLTCANRRYVHMSQCNMHRALIGEVPLTIFSCASKNTFSCVLSIERSAS
jgi:hypothetical protein